LKKTYNIDVEAGWSDWDASAALMASQLARVGIHAKVQQLNFSVPMPTATLATGNFDMGLNWTSSGLPSPYPVFHDWMWGYYKAPVGKTGIFNWERYNNPAMNRLIVAYSATASLSKQIALVKRMEAIGAADVPIVPVVNQALWFEGNASTVTGFPTKSHPYDLGPPWENRWMEDVALHLHLR
jgi:peptide/nickel transport system substrate-binding protein